MKRDVPNVVIGDVEFPDRVVDGKRSVRSGRSGTDGAAISHHVKAIIVIKETMELQH